MTPVELTSDARHMRAALAQAQAAGTAGEVPVGAVVVLDGRIIGAGCNAPLHSNDPTAHAEILALRNAAQYLGNYRLDNCELFVTLEPCTMCAGAMLHARIKRVVFGASDAKTGAAGSVSNVFAVSQLNHHTQVQGGVLAPECTALLQDFFKQQRARQQLAALHTGKKLRDDALRTPESRFATLPAFPAPSLYVNDLPSLDGLRLHYVDTHPGNPMHTVLCLHSPQEWGYAWRDRIHQALGTPQRLICPDLVGFGKSDKPKKQGVHSLAWHARVLLELMQQLELAPLEVLAPRDTLALAWQLQALAPELVLAISEVSTAPLDPLTMQAPFPDKGYRAGPRAFSCLKMRGL